MTKLARAKEIVLANPDKAIALACIMEQLGVTRSNAFVYYTKCTKGTEKNSGKNTEKTDVNSTDLKEKATKSVKKSAKTSKNLESVDTMIANLKANGGNTVFGVI